MAALNDLSDLVTLAAEESPERVALVEAGGRSLTWAGLEDEVARVASGLESAGMVAGYRVLLAMSNRIEFATTYLGALRAHVIAVPVNPRSTADELSRMIADSGARIVVADETTVATVREALSQPPADEPPADEPPADEPPAEEPTAAGPSAAGAPRLVVAGTGPGDGEWAYDRLLDPEPRPVPRRHDPEGLAVLLYTSGTSGRPRGAMLTHRALLANLEQVAQVEPPMIHRDDVVLGVLPLFHVYGLNAVLGGVLRHQARLVLVEGFDPEGCLALVEEQQVSVLPVAPPVFAHWLPRAGLRDRLGSVRLVLSGSAPLSAEDVLRFGEVTGIPVHQGYGLTEAAPVVTSTLVDTAPPAGSVGAALPGIEVRIVDDAGTALSGEDPGEVAIRGDNLFSGYWPDGDDGPDEQGWWRTGDVGLLDAVGNLTLVDRVRELVIVSGFNVYPVEVEEVLTEVDGVSDAAVIGVEDPLTGEAVVAYLRIDGEPGDVLARVEAHCERRLARFKRPTRIEVVDELPYTGTGKVQKGRLRGIERRRATRLIEEAP